MLSEGDIIFKEMKIPNKSKVGDFIESKNGEDSVIGILTKKKPKNRGIVQVCGSTRGSYSIKGEIRNLYKENTAFKKALDSFIREIKD